MKFNARQPHPPEERSKFVQWLLEETASALKAAAGDQEGIRAAVFLYLHRAYEAGLPAEEITDLLWVSPQNAMTKAELSRSDEELVLQAFEELDSLIEEVYTRA